MLHDHPTVEDLAGFLREASRPGHAARNAKILRHLLAECRVCHDQLDAMGWSSSRLGHLVYLPGRTDEREEQPRARANGHNYDRAFARAEQAIDDFLAVAPLPRTSPGQLLK